MSSLKELESKSVYIIRELKSRYKNPAVLVSWGKDSIVLLDVIRKAFYGEIPFPVVHIDTNQKFKEIYELRDKLVKEGNINLIIAENSKGERPKDTFTCCNQLKTQALKQCIKKHKFDIVIVGIRRDEHGIRGKEHYFSPRDKDFKWKTSEEQKDGDSGLKSLQDPEFSGWDIYADYFGKETDHVRCHPLLHWTEENIWEYTQHNNLPINPLYFSKDGKRYRSIGCQPCTEPIESNARNIKEIIEELKENKTSERAGRRIDKEQHMEKLRSLGYM
ncbi:MAG: sulfate adenylyltransferase subunit CysD [Nanoarchaeota archaeon]|nr:sulfate adenylyltransferase subunit CysD [Nanoarchaeota archaeon]